MRTRGVASDLPLEMSIYYSTLGLATTVESTRGKHLRDSVYQNKDPPQSPNQGAV